MGLKKIVSIEIVGIQTKGNSDYLTKDLLTISKKRKSF
jgi:hypothetical protein